MKFLLKNLRNRGILLLTGDGTGVLINDESTSELAASPLRDFDYEVSLGINDFDNRHCWKEESCFYFKSRGKEYLLIDDEEKAIILFCITDNNWMKFAYWHSYTKSLKQYGFTILPSTVSKKATLYFGQKLWNNLAGLPEPDHTIHKGELYDTDEIY